MLRIIAAITAVLLVASPAQAKHHAKHAYKHYAKTQKWQPSGLFDQAAIAPYPTAETHQNRIIANPMGRRHIAPTQGYDVAERVIGGRHAGDPYQFCGAEASRYVFGATKRELWLAANWLRFPSTFPAPGMAAARQHHVMILISHVEGSNWLVHDGNSGGHLTREHVRSISGYHIVNPGSRMASR